MTSIDETLIGRMFAAAEAAVLIIDGEGDHADLRQGVELYRVEREMNPASYDELRDRWGEEL